MDELGATPDNAQDGDSAVGANKAGGAIEDASDAFDRTEAPSGVRQEHSAGAPRPAARTRPLRPDSWNRIRRQYMIFSNGEYRLLAAPQRVAFRDQGKQISTEHDDPQVVRAMLDVAAHKGWRRVNLVGSETFRRLAWLEAGTRSIQTTGYAPTQEDRQRLKEWLSERVYDEHARAGGANRAGGAARAGTYAPAFASPAVSPDSESRSDGNPQVPFGTFMNLVRQLKPMTVEESRSLNAAKTDMEREHALGAIRNRWAREATAVRAMTPGEISRLRGELGAGRLDEARAVVRETIERQAAGARLGAEVGGAEVAQGMPASAAARQRGPRAEARAQADSHQIVLAVAEEVLKQRRVGEVTRQRVAAALARKLEELRLQGRTAQAQIYDRSAPAADKPILVPKRRPDPSRTR
jgi:hypothetical protein